MDYLKETVFKTMRHTHKVRESQLDCEIARLEKELEETAASLAKLKNEQENNREAVKAACEMFGFVIGGYKDDLTGKGELFYDKAAADRASRKTKYDFIVEASMSVGVNSLAKLLVEEGRLPNE